MGAPLFLAENFFNVQQFPDHIVTSTAAAQVGNEAFRVGNARRSVLSRFRLADPTVAMTLRVTLPRARAADTLVIDRNASIANRQVTLFANNNPGDLGQQVFIGVVPDAVVLGSSLNAPVHSIRTHEGVFIYHFPLIDAIEWSVAVATDNNDAGFMGGLYLGKSFSPALPRMPFDDEATWSDFDAVRRGVPDNDIRHGRTGAFSMMMNSESEWNEARRQLRELFGKGHPMWIVPDSDMAERTWFGYNAPGSVGAVFSERPQGRSVVITADEYDPALP